MEITTKDAEFIDALILSGWIRGSDPTKFYWLPSRLPRA